ncbi:hypothetical protein [Bifidobacterium sp. SO1]|uniref:hypothetical protein n=1 Tax=Bifidobacterium sp. SO1 TaxID=2809029 RepID=UPI001BDC5463|nr:hypothetical protein [Bifidobacterium sp. SO1]MBT1161279.1 hypothetical protein [Bifidobacterium sp. SO1]
MAEKLNPIDQMRLLGVARGIVPQDELERRANHLIDMYVESVLEDAKPNVESPTLTISAFMRSKGVEPLKKSALRFGYELATAYKKAHGVEPPKHGSSYLYYEIDRPLMETVWSRIQESDK